MLIDTRSEFCAATALNTGGVGSYILGNSINLKDLASDLGNGSAPLYLVIHMSTTATGGGATTGAFALVTDDDVNIGSANVIVTSAAIAVASLVASTQVVNGWAYIVQLPPKAVYQQYLAIRQTTGGAAFATGAINAFLTTDINAWQAYNNGVTS